MGITERQRQKRRTGLGSSDVAAVCGLDPWRSPVDVFLEKTMDMDEIQAGDMAELGNEFEEPLIRFAKDEIEKRVKGRIRTRRNVERRRGVFLVHIDAQIMGSNQIIEAKLSGDAARWGKTSLEEPSDQVPPYVVCQTHSQMIAGRATRTWIPALLGSYKRMEKRLYRVELDEELASALVEKCTAFWETYVVPGVRPPDDYPASMEVLKRIVRMPGSWAGADPDLLHAYIESERELAEAKRKHDESKRFVLEAMGQSEGLRADGCDHEFTYFQRPGRATFGRGKGYDSCCDACGIGVKQGKEFRVLQRRKRTV